MKKILLVFVCSLFAFETVLAQEKNAVGLRLGDGVEFLYQRDLSSRNFLQFTLATPHFEGLSVTGIYNWRCCRWNWTPRTCDWYLNAGVGGALGLYDFDDSGFLLLRFRLSFQKCPDLFGGGLPSCDRSRDRRWTWRLLWSRILEFRIVRQIPFLKLWMIVIYS